MDQLAWAGYFDIQRDTEKTVVVVYRRDQHLLWLLLAFGDVLLSFCHLLLLVMELQVVEAAILTHSNGFHLQHQFLFALAGLQNFLSLNFYYNLYIRHLSPRILVTAVHNLCHVYACHSFVMLSTHFTTTPALLNTFGTPNYVPIIKLGHTSYCEWE